MSQLNHFDAASYPPRREHSTVPAGSYGVKVIHTEHNVNNAGTGSHERVDFEICDGDYAGRQIPTWLNLKHPNETTVRLAYRELAEICRAADVLQPKDTTELHGRPLTINVRVKKRRDTGDLVNEISGYGPPEDPTADATDNHDPAPWKK